MFMFSFSISFVYLVVILLILCAIPLWDSATAHSSSGKELNPSSQEDVRFSGRCTLGYNFHFILRHLALGLSSTPSGKELKLSSLEEWCFSGLIILLMFSHYLFCFGTHPYYLLNPYVHLYYLWCISIAKGHRYPKHSILCVVYFYSDRPTLCREV